jgi:hypothetical protein
MPGHDTAISHDEFAVSGHHRTFVLGAHTSVPGRQQHQTSGEAATKNTSRPTAGSWQLKTSLQTGKSGQFSPLFVSTIFPEKQWPAGVNVLERIERLHSREGQKSSNQSSNIQTNDPKGIGNAVSKPRSCRSHADTGQHLLR